LVVAEINAARLPQHGEDLVDLRLPVAAALSLLGFRLTQVEMLTDPGKLLGKRTESTEPALVAWRGMS